MGAFETGFSVVQLHAASLMPLETLWLRRKCDSIGKHAAPAVPIYDSLGENAVEYIVNHAGKHRCVTGA